jgi:hypothetical protein
MWPQVAFVCYVRVVIMQWSREGEDAQTHGCKRLVGLSGRFATRLVLAPRRDRLRTASLLFIWRYHARGHLETLRIRPYVRSDGEHYQNTGCPPGSCSRRNTGLGIIPAQAQDTATDVDRPWRRSGTALNQGNAYDATPGVVHVRAAYTVSLGVASQACPGKGSWHATFSSAPPASATHRIGGNGGNLPSDLAVAAYCCSEKERALILERQRGSYEQPVAPPGVPQRSVNGRSWLKNQHCG